MTRTTLWTLALLTSLVACGEPEEISAVSAAARKTAPRPTPARESTLEPTRATEPERRTAQPPAPLTRLIEGHVLDVRSGRGVEGCEVGVKGNGDRLPTHSGPDGYFRAEVATDSKLVSVIVKPREGWRWIDFRQMFSRFLTSEEINGAEPLELFVAERRRGRLTGIAVDARTGEPLPHLGFAIISLSSKFPAQDVVTDDAGRFVTQDEIPDGALKVIAASGEGRPSKGRHEVLAEHPSTTPWVIEFAVGPTFDVHVRGAVPPDRSKLQLWLVDPASNRTAAKTHLRQRADGSLWARPPAPPRGIEEGDLFVVVVGSSDGTRLGFQHVRGGAGFPALIDVTLERTGALEVRSMEKAPTGNPWRVIPTHLEVRAPAADFPLKAWRLAQRRGLPAGDYQVAAWSRVHERQERVVSLRAGEVQQLEFHLSLGANPRRIRGRYRTEYDAPIGDLSLLLHLKDQPETRWRASYQKGLRCGTGVDHFISIESDRRSGSFLIERVPEGELEVQVISSDRLVLASVSGGTTDDILVDVREVRLTRGMGFRFKRENGEAVGRYEPDLWIRRDGGPWNSSYIRDGELVLDGGPETRRFEWALRVRDRTVYGDQDDFEHEGEGRWFVQRSFAPGFAKRVRVVDPEGRTSAGVSVFLDGALVGSTDAQGRCLVSSDSQPRRISARDDDGAAARASSWRGQAEVELVLERP